MMTLPPVVRYILIFAVLIVSLYVGYKVMRKYFSGIVNEPTPAD